MLDLKNLPLRLRRWEQSEYLLRRHSLKRAPATLAKLATIGGGPQLEWINGIPFSRPEWLDEWVDGLTSRPAHSTAALERAAL